MTGVFLASQRKPRVQKEASAQVWMCLHLKSLPSRGLRVPGSGPGRSMLEAQVTTSAVSHQGLRRPRSSQLSLLLSRPPPRGVSDCVPRCAPQLARPGLGSSSLSPVAASSLFCSPLGTEGRHPGSTLSRAVEKGARKRRRGDGGRGGASCAVRLTPGLATLCVKYAALQSRPG